MALTSETNSITWAGNGSTATHYTVPFKVLSADHIRVEVKAAGEDEYTPLVAGQFTVHGTGPDNFTLTTAVAYPGTTSLTIFRWIPLTQGLVLPLAGSLPGPGIERSLDLLVMQLQQIYRVVTGFGTVSLTELSELPGLKVFANATARGNAVPDFAGQAGVQLDTRELYVATSGAQGAWFGSRPAFPAVRYFATRAEMLALAPDYKGQLAWVAPDEYPFFSHGTGTGNWSSIITPVITNWHAVPWRHDETIESGGLRWTGHLGQLRKITHAFISVAQPGSGTLQVQICVRGPSGLVPVMSNVLTLTSSVTAAFAGPDTGVSINSALNGSWLDPMTPVEVKIVSIGEPLTLDTTGGSSVTTPPGTALAHLSTGVQVKTLTDGGGGTGTVNSIGYVLAVNGAGTVRMSSNAASSDTGATATSTGRHFLRGVFPAEEIPAGSRTVTVDAITASLLRIGDKVIGAAVQPGTLIHDINSTTNVVTLSQPVTADTNLLSFLNEKRPPVSHFTALLWSGVPTAGGDGETVVALPVTTHLHAGDSVIGAGVPAHTRVVSKTSGSITLSHALTADITELTVTWPVRTATVGAGSTAMTLNAGTVPVGSLVSGPGVPADTYVIELDGTEATLSRPVTLPLAGESVQFSRDDIQFTWPVTAGATTINLGVNVSLETAIERYFSIEAAELQPGTSIASISGSVITLSKPVALTNAAGAVLRINRNAPWKGLAVSLAGSAYPYYP